MSSGGSCIGHSTVIAAIVSAMVPCRLDFVGAKDVFDSPETASVFAVLEIWSSP